MKMNAIPSCYLGFGLSLFTVATAQAHSASKEPAKRYGVNLQIGPAEVIASDAMAPQSGGIIFQAGAQPVAAPRGDDFRHVGVYVYRGDQQVKDADVQIVCEPLDTGADAKAIVVPVAHLYTSEKGPQAPHFGNNVELESGTYRVNVLLDGHASADFLVEI